MNKYDIYKKDLMQNIDMIMNRKMTDYQDLKHLEHLMDMCCKMDEWSEHEEENVKMIDIPMIGMENNKLLEHHNNYLEYKNQYKNSHSMEDKMKMLEELNYFIDCEKEMFDKIMNNGLDCMEERNVIKSFLQETYSKIMS